MELRTSSLYSVYSVQSVVEFLWIQMGFLISSGTLGDGALPLSKIVIVDVLGIESDRLA